MAALRDLSALPEQYRAPVTVTDYAGLAAAVVRSGVSITATQEITVAASLAFASSVTLRGPSFLKDYDGAALFHVANGNGFVDIFTDFAGSTGIGAGRLLFGIGHNVTLQGSTRSDVVIGVYRENATVRNCLEIAGDNSVMVFTGGVPTGTDAGDLGHVSGGDGSRVVATDATGFDDCVGVFPRAGGDAAFRDISNVDVTIINGESTHSRLFAFGIPETADFDAAPCTVTGITARVSGSAFTEGRVSPGDSQAGVMQINNSNLPTARVSDFEVTGSCVVGPGGDVRWGARAYFGSDGVMTLSLSGVWSEAPTDVTGCVDVTINQVP